MGQILETLFGSKNKVRLLRFFLLNPDQQYPLSEIARKNIVKMSDARRELNNFLKIKFILKRFKNRKVFYVLNSGFPFYPELRNLFVKSNVYPQCRSLGRIKDTGDVKLAVISGAFLNYPKSRADMVLVVNNLNRRRLKNLMGNLEAEIGKEINFVLMNSEEFKYRLNMMDRFLMEFLRGPHDELINKIPGLKNLINDLKKS
ncbi:MAG: hypothetical protein A3J63_03615 [Candidatus Moranbacteria bacterium RIFCSPHIGHO2_02_FULL_40_12b]|nr:MAG: hypothetical protein A3J63_03615 [Candidatus Moranbacteria bacterium RIFCSPHIGHO2_02_FULL_40_12b]OGI23972.1 MAG: hypothetical protein A3E91_02310 [Candidatus Moranbacteria bacterium RIFCSPHIGHO2_12_FULL_40_10]